MIIIADSGSTKTDWIFMTETGEISYRQKTEGINPFHQDEKTIRSVLHTLDTSVLQTSDTLSNNKTTSIHFYGSGLRPEFKTQMKSLLADRFMLSEDNIEAEDDLLGAARALCRRKEGIACILGTGANSCLYDGNNIIDNTPSLGYILGDEGSGAVIGRNLLNIIYKNKELEPLRRKFEETYNVNMADVIRKVYREPLANRWMASLTIFINEYKIDFPKLRKLLTDSFHLFFQNNLLPYHRQDLPVSAVGSIAYHFREEFTEVATKEGFAISKILQSPLDGLIAYHKKEYPSQRMNTPFHKLEK